MTLQRGSHYSEQELHEYLDGRFSDEDVERLRLHIGTCDDCAAKLADFKALFTSIEALPEVDHKIDLSDGVVGSIQSEQKSWAAGRWLLGLQVLVALGLLFFSRSLINQLSAIEPITNYFENLDMTAAANQAIAVMMHQIDALGAGIADLLDQTVTSLPSTPPGINFWAIAVAGGVLWLAVYFSVLRPSQGDRNRNGAK